ncbi:MAG: ABC transporter permease [Saprospiraceae bacterium]|nr:ABC transporter permease [Saprospiraceae bacterium]
MSHSFPDLPKWANRFLEWYCPAELLEEIQGDLYESFEINEATHGAKRAKQLFAWEVLRFFNYSTLKNHRFWILQQIHLAMITKHLQFIFRRLGKQKLHTALHVLGLTIGLTVCLLIGVFIFHELSYDGYHEQAQRTFRVNQVWEDESEKSLDYSAPYPLSIAIREELPDVSLVGVAYPQSEKVIEIEGEKRFKQSHILMADPGLLDIFDFKIIRGNAKEAMASPNKAILSQATAQKFFGSADPIGKTFIYNNKQTVEVAGVMKNQPNNTHLPANILLSYFPQSKFILGNLDNWSLTFGASTYVVLPEGVQPSSIESSIRAMFDIHVNDEEEDPEVAYAQLQALEDIHLQPEVDGGSKWVDAINPIWLWFFSGISLLVLVLACINFINLSTAQALTSAKEVGVRKAIGANRTQLVAQFLTEAFILILSSSVIAYLLAFNSISWINELLERNIDSGLLLSPIILLGFIGFLFITGFLTGIYPAWLISRFQPAQAIRSSSSHSDRQSNFLRKALVVTQFSISGALLVALFIMSQQMSLFHNTQLGFEKENILTVDMPDVEKNEVFERAIQQLPQVEAISFALAAPAGEDTWTTDMHLMDLNAPDRQSVRIIWADEVFDDLYGLKLLAGRFTTNQDTIYTSSSLPREERHPKVVVNEKLIKSMEFGSPEEALGKRFVIGINEWKAEIVGVMEDFNISSLHEAIEPLIISPLERYQWAASIKLQAGQDIPSTLASIKSAWEEIFPKHIYDFNFLDQTIERYYEGEGRLYGLFKIFAFLALLISCLGLWGLATFAALQRTKEIGIRKVLGANLGQLIVLLSKDFIRLIVISLVVAIPLAWYGMNKWLQNFAYSIDMQWWFFALSAIIVLIIALFTISFQSIRTARLNPISSLRNE